MLSILTVWLANMLEEQIFAVFLSTLFHTIQLDRHLCTVS